jgi:hypothetical protein
MDPKEAAKVAYTATHEMSKLKKGNPGWASSVPTKVREHQALAAGVREMTPEVQKTLRAVVALQIAGFSQPEIDTLLGKNPKFTENMISRLRAEWRVQKQAHIDAVVEQFHAARIEIWERVLVMANDTIAYWHGVMHDPEATNTLKTTAFKETREWASLILKSDKSSQVARDLLSGEEEATAEKGMEMEQRMKKLIRKGKRHAGDEPN